MYNKKIDNIKGVLISKNIFLNQEGCAVSVAVFRLTKISYKDK